MRRPTPSSASGSTVGYYAIILILVCACLWVMSSSPESLTKDSNSKVLELVLEENARLNSAVAACTKADAAPAPKLRAGQECDCSAKTTELELEVEDLRAQLRKANAALASAEASKKAVAVSNPSGGAWPQTCAGVKLEFLRWSKDANGNQLSCPFNPENYDKWEKMPPLCDYLSIECLGEKNLRSAHVFGFGGPGLMIGYADTMMWEFVFARHKSHKHMAELGTMTGGTSLYFGMAARTRGGRFDTFDRSDNRVSEVKMGWLDNMHFHIQDILTGVKADDLSTHNKEVVKVLDINEPMIALFDNGDKTRETNNYCRYLKVGSVLLLHDWEHLGLPKPHWEMTYDYVKEELEGRGFVPAYFDFADHIGSSTRAFIRTSLGALSD